MRLPRFRNLAIPVVGALTTVMVTASAAAAKDKDAFSPAGIGNMLPVPESTYSGTGTLYEQYGDPNLWRLDSELGWKDIADSMLNGIAVIFMGLTVVLGLAAIVVVQWSFKFTKIDKLGESIAGAVSGAAETVVATLLPTALAVGVLVAWINHRKANGSALNQIGWVLASGVLAASLLTTPKAWVDGIESTRTIGSTVAMEATSGGLGEGGKEPIDVGQPSYKGNSTQDSVLRKSADAIWRSYVATPWCIAEFGSLDACKEFGQDLLKEGSSAKKRKEWLSHNVDGKPENGGEATLRWRQGHTPEGRIMVAIPAFICVALFAALAVALAFASLASLIGAFMLLIAGVVFACLWVIPGRPRQWGVRWFDTLLGFTLQSLVSTMVLGCVLIMNTVSVRLLDDFGWFAAAGLSITSALVAFKFRTIMESIVGVTGAVGGGAGAAGLLAARSAGRLAAFGARTLGKGSATKEREKPRWDPNRTNGGTSKSEEGAGATLSRLPKRPLPLPTRQGGGAVGEIATAAVKAELEAGAKRPDIPSTAGLGRVRPEGPAGALPARRTAELGSLRPRPALSAGSTGGARTTRPAAGAKAAEKSVEKSAVKAVKAVKEAAKQAAEQPAGRPSAALRPENGSGANYAFRQGPRPGAAAPRVIRGEVVVRHTGPAGGSGPKPARTGRQKRSAEGRAPVPGRRRKG
ncbi:hypothetical protein AF335_13525 [Streptomyces eurocidicus]|uniref:Integral membrane protein n=1 Tax=Streptomyces eurocidicus TaxID=66423 RepID=A0A2N8NYH4_STREU|nr:hypothetical protein [Streptomyces eurocidicus]MBB5121371.1 hypothetical protein [Streptomyces eurocidicus]MBF6050976.1 hypothetical protein [Streptomyces eurocidicus]PNE33813.1 hypothetical protein AF335_13525 [Streptomyces eurocidicus]